MQYAGITQTNSCLLPVRASKQGNVIGSVRIYIYSRRQYKVSVPFKKNRCPMASQRFKTVTVYRFDRVYTVTIFTRHFLSNSAQIHQ